HRGETYLVTDLELDRGVAFLEQAKLDYFTIAVAQSVVEPGVVVAEKGVPGILVQNLGVSVTTAVTGFRRMRLDGQTVISEEPLELPSQTFDTVAMRLDFDEAWLPIVEPETMIVAHTLEHMLMSLAPLRAGCDKNDLRSAWYALAADTMRASVYLF